MAFPHPRPAPAGGGRLTGTTMSEQAAPEPGPLHPYRWAMLAGAWLTYFCFGLTTTALAPLIGPVTEELGISHSAMGAILGAWPLVYIGAAIPCGAFVDRFGPGRSLFLAAVVIAASGLGRGVSAGPATLFLAVALFGLGGPLVSIGAPKLIALWFEGKERGLAMGVYITGPSLGGIVALSITNSVMMPLFGGDWRQVLIAYAGFVLLSAVAGLLVSFGPAGRVVESRLSAEPRVSQSQVFLDLVKLGPVRIVLLMSVGIFLFNHALNNWLPEILRSGGMDAATAGFWAAVPPAVGIAGSLIIPRLAVAERRIAILIGLFVAASAAPLLIATGQGPSLAAGLVLQGIARSAMMTVSLLIVMEIPQVGPQRTGAAAGLFFSAAEIGGVSGPVAIGLLFDATGGFGAGLVLLSAVSAGMILLTLALGAAARRT